MLVHFWETKDTSTGVRVPIVGRLRFRATRSRVIVGTPDEEVLPAPFSVALDADGKADVTLPATSLSWAWEVSLYGDDAGWGPFYVAVPAGVECDWPDLVRVDPATLDPDAAPEAAWWAAIEGVTGDIGQAVADYLVANPPTADVTMADLTGHAADTTAVHGIADTSALVVTTDARLSDARTPTAHTHTPADVTGTAVITTDGRLSDSRTPTAHKATHATGGTDALTPADIGAAPASHTHTLDQTTDTATRLALTPDERTKLTNTSGTNTGDQVLPTWATLSGKPAVIAAGATQSDARTAIGAGTSSLVIGTGAGDAKAGNYSPPDATTSVKGLVQLAGDLAGTAAAPTVVAASETVAGKVELATTAEATTGTDTVRAVTPAGVKAVADTKAATSHTHDDRYYTETEADARFAPAVQTVNAQTAAYTLVAGDAGKLVTMTLSTAGDLTVPANVVTVPAGTVVRVDVLDLGTARVTFVQGSGMALTGAPTLVSSARYAGFSVIFTSATTATVVGALASA